MLLHIWYYVITIIYCLFVYTNCCMDNITLFLIIYKLYTYIYNIISSKEKEKENIILKNFSL